MNGDTDRCLPPSDALSDEPTPYRLCIVPSAEKSGLDLLSDWIRRDPSHRVLDRIALNSNTGAVTVELRGKGGVYTSSTQLTLDSALRTALMVAWNSEGK